MFHGHSYSALESFAFIADPSRGACASDVVSLSNGNCNIPGPIWADCARGRGRWIDLYLAPTGRGRALPAVRSPQRLSDPPWMPTTVPCAMPHAEGGSAPVIINRPMAPNTQTFKFTSSPVPLNRAITDARTLSTPYKMTNKVEPIRQ
jgi:hypothetical protein